MNNVKERIEQATEVINQLNKDIEELPFNQFEMIAQRRELSYWRGYRAGLIDMAKEFEKRDARGNQ